MIFKKHDLKIIEIGGKDPLKKISILNKVFTIICEKATPDKGHYWCCTMYMKDEVIGILYSASNKFGTDEILQSLDNFLNEKRKHKMIKASFGCQK